MKAYIKKIELKKVINRYYFRIELVDSEKRSYILDKPFASDSINFRRQVFGLMAACNNFDLLRLATDNPKYKEVVGYYMNGLQIIENKSNEWFSYNKSNAVYFCDKAPEDIKQTFKELDKRNLFDYFISEGKIESISSQSGTLQIFFNGKGGATSMVSGQVYYGMGYPIEIGSEENAQSTMMAANAFKSFIIAIMKFYDINDLLLFGGKVDKYPEVELTLNDKNRISCITNPDTGMGVAIDKGYKIINILEQNSKKVL